MRVVLAFVVWSVAACSGDTPAEIDANPAGPKCSMQPFDLCVEEHDCTSNICQNFQTQGFQVCTQACSPDNPCPNDRSGSPAACDNGVCVPSAPNMCHL
jgi:hypothetical protein